MKRLTVAIAGAVLVALSPQSHAAEGRIPIPFTAPVTFPISITEGGEYVLTRNLQDASGVSLIEIATTAPVTIDLNGMTIEGAATAESHALIASTAANESVTIRSGVLKGGHHGMEIVNARKVLVEDVTVQGPFLHGISVTGVATALVRRCLVSGVGSTGIVALGCRAVEVEECSVVESAREAIVVQLGGPLSSFAVRRNQVSITGLPAITIVDEENGIVAENLVSGAGSEFGAGITCSGARNVAVTGNQIRGSKHEGIRIDPSGLQPSVGITVSDNRIMGCGGSGIHVDGAQVRVESNHVIDSGSWGIRVLQGSAVLGRNTAVGNHGSDCAGTARGADACFEQPVTSFGDNLIPPSMGLF